MNRPPLIRRQLRAFGVLTAAAVAAVALFYVRIPALLGYGRYDISVELPTAAGLHPHAPVTVRGFEVGTVTHVDLKPTGGVLVRLQIENGTRIASSAIASVRSGSVIGENYLDFVSATHDGSGGFLSPGATVPASRTHIPVTTDHMISAVEQLLASIPKDDLRTVVDELADATTQLGRPLGTLLDDASVLSTTARDNLGATTSLVDDLDPVLATQEQMDPHIRAYAHSLRDVTGELARSDDALRTILRTGSGFFDTVDGLSDGLQRELPRLLTDTAATAAVARVYLPGIEHVLILLPAAVATFTGSVPPDRLTEAYPTANLYFKMSFPTACTKGFPEKDKMRDPTDVSLAPLPKDSYCKVPRDSALVVRGARNNPCPNSAERSATAAGCGLVFDPVAVERANALRSGENSMIDPAMMRLLAPNGPLFLLDRTAVPGPRSWEQMLRLLTSR